MNLISNGEVNVESAFIVTFIVVAVILSNNAPKVLTKGIRFANPTPKQIKDTSIGSWEKAEVNSLPRRRCVLCTGNL
jgi:hypothetical protein